MFGSENSTEKLKSHANCQAKSPRLPKNHFLNTHSLIQTKGAQIKFAFVRRTKWQMERLLNNQLVVDLNRT